MHAIGGKLLLLATICAASIGLSAQSFKLFDRTVQVHGFASQGFAYSNDNNYLTMNTSSGSGALTDGGLNLSTTLTDKFRVGAQGYVRNIGQLGKGHVDLDWALADYRFKPWFGVRGGKVKTALGLYNDVQDTESLFTWALLPQSMYPLDLRSDTISHIGGDVYGTITLGHKIGSVAYTAYYGERSFDPRGGYYYFSQDQGIPIKSVSGRAAGMDVRWSPRLRGLMVGASFMDQTQIRDGRYTIPVPVLFDNPYHFVADPQRITAAYADYTIGNWHFDTEFRRGHYMADITTPALPFVYRWDGSNTGWFGSVAYRITKRLELGTYNSRYYVDFSSVPGSPDENPDPASHHIFDQTATARFDINRFWNVKVEGHFIDGYGDIYSAHGFYLRNNSDGLKPKTNMLVLRTGFNF